MPDVNYKSVTSHEGEIDLIDLLWRVWERRLLVILIVSIFASAAIVYIYMAKPTFEASTGVLPPLSSDVAVYNYGRSEASLPLLGVDDVYKIFLRSLTSDSLKMEFFKKFYLPALAEASHSEAGDKLWRKFNQRLIIGSPDRLRSDYLRVTMQDSDPVRAAEWANQFVLLAADRADRAVRKNLSREVEQRVSSIQRQINNLKVSAKKREADRIVVLEEALTVAIRVGLEAPQVTVGRTSSTKSISDFVDGNLMYMRGAKAIRAELDVLRHRKSIEPFIPELRDLEQKLAFLEQIEANRSGNGVFSSDGLATPPSVAIKPNRVLILVASVLMGFAFAVFFVVAPRLINPRWGDRASAV